jgi:hypothetical protein
MTPPRVVRNFTDEQVRNLFRTALGITAELDPPDELAVACFNGVASMLANFHQEVSQSHLPVAPASMAEQLRRG